MFSSLATVPVIARAAATAAASAGVRAVDDEVLESRDLCAKTVPAAEDAVSGRTWPFAKAGPDNVGSAVIPPWKDERFAVTAASSVVIWDAKEESAAM